MNTFYCQTQCTFFSIHVTQLQHHLKIDFEQYKYPRFLIVPKGTLRSTVNITCDFHFHLGFL